MTVISKVLPAVELAGVGLVFIGSTSVVANDNLGRLHTFGIHLGAEDFFANRSTDLQQLRIRDRRGRVGVKGIGNWRALEFGELQFIAIPQINFGFAVADAHQLARFFVEDKAQAFGISIFED